jgi:hypothetical protein
MTRAEKYNFKIGINQHKQAVPAFWEDVQEKGLIDLFEGCCLNLKEKNKPHYSMIELGSNWAYYSLLFKHILGKDKTLCIMIEPVEESLQVGKSNFALNDCEGVFYKKGIGSSMEFYGEQVSIETITLNELLKLHNINEIDILHCDIDTAEVQMIKSNIDFFQNKRAKFIFILTHGDEYAKICKEQFVQLPYKLLTEQGHGSQGGDGLLIYKSL